jgi:hypothetical protein
MGTYCCQQEKVESKDELAVYMPPVIPEPGAKRNFHSCKELVIEVDRTKLLNQMLLISTEQKERMIQEAAQTWHQTRHQPQQRRSFQSTPFLVKHLNRPPSKVASHSSPTISELLRLSFCSPQKLSSSNPSLL